MRAVVDAIACESKRDQWLMRKLAARLSVPHQCCPAIAPLHTLCSRPSCLVRAVRMCVSASPVTTCDITYEQQCCRHAAHMHAQRSALGTRSLSLSLSVCTQSCCEFACKHFSPSLCSAPLTHPHFLTASLPLVPRVLSPKEKLVMTLISLSFAAAAAAASATAKSLMSCAGHAAARLMLSVRGSSLSGVS